MNLAEFLADTPRLSVRGMPMYKSRVFFLDVVLSTDDAAIRVTGQASDVENRTEAFFLITVPFNPAESWRGVGRNPGWETVDLTAKWRGSPLEGLWFSPRVVKYYFAPADRERGLAPQGTVDSAAAIEFRSAGGEAGARLVLYATTEYPCSIEVATTPEHCDRILGVLEEFSPPSTRTTKVDEGS
jgi:hypothetical protein